MMGIRAFKYIYGTLAVKTGKGQIDNEVEDKKPDMYPICQMNPLSFQIC